MIFKQPLIEHLLTDEARLAWLSRRLGLVVSILLVGFIAFYVYDRYLVRVESPMDRAVQSLEDAVWKSPNDPELRVQVANAYVRQGRHEAAILQYQEALKLRADWQPALLALANAEFARGNQARTETIYRQVVEMNKDSDYRYANRDLGVVYFRLATFATRDGRHAEAAEWAKDALRVDWTDADALLILGASEEALGDLAAAGRAYRQATAFDPNFREAFASLHRVMTAQGERREAAYASSMAQLAAGDIDSALAGFKQLTAEAPEYGEAFQGLGLAYGKKGLREDARGAFRTALERNPDLVLAQWSLSSLDGGR